MGLPLPTGRVAQREAFYRRSDFRANRLTGIGVGHVPTMRLGPKSERIGTVPVRAEPVRACAAVLP